MTFTGSYTTGQASVSNGATAVTGTGTAWAKWLQAGDYFNAQGLMIEIASVTDDTHLTLAENWPGTTLSTAAYKVLYVSDRGRAVNNARVAIDTLKVPKTGQNMVFDGSSTASGDPGAGKVRANSASNPTALYISYTDNDGNDITNLVKALDDVVNATSRCSLSFRPTDGASAFLDLNVTGAITDNTTYATVPVSRRAGTVPADKAALAMSAVPSGADGAAGAAGAAGSNGTNGGLFVLRAVATSNVTIASGLENGDTIDGVTLATGDAVLLTGQTAAAENGVYTVVASGGASRHASYNSYNAIAGQYFGVMEGTTNHDTLWRCTSDKGGTLGSTALAISAVVSGIGGSTGSTDNALLRADGTGGSTVQDSAITVDDSGNITSFGGRIAFPATQNASGVANVLDDYEEGTFTPVVEGTTTAGVGTYVAQIGNYVKIGKSVTFMLECVWTAHTGTGNMQFSGLPFTNGPAQSVCGIEVSNLTYAAQLFALIAASNTIVTPYTSATGGANTAVPMDAAATFRASGVYIAAG